MYIVYLNTIFVLADKTWPSLSVMNNRQKYKTYRYPMVLQNNNCEFTDHITNMMMTNTIEDHKWIEETSVSNSFLPLIFVIIAISEPVMFEEEFIEGFLKQKYPKENLIICISTKSKHLSK